MKKTFFFFIVLLAIATATMAQGVTVRFTARSTNGQYHPFESVRVENETQGWSQRIDYPDTIIVLGSSESIDVAEAIKGPQIKVYPNPFAGRTSTELQICEDGEATVSIMRINGSVVSEYNGFLKAGIYRLNVSLAEPQVAFLCVSTRSGRTVAKMVNTATGTADKIDISYLEGYSSQTKAVGIGPFNVGDQMSYNANYTSSNGITTSNTVTQSQTTSELITLFFTESSSTTLPTVTTSTVSNTTSSTATCGGNVTNDGNATVTARGVCWSTSHNPTVSDSHTTDGSGTGSFTSSITGLSQNTTYYVRAYATNSVGTAYGEERTFTTSASVSLPTVTTSAVSSITSSSATCGGNVTNDGNATVTARGVCWSTSYNPTISNSHTTDGSGTGNFTSSMTGLSQNTTYYVRAYATNSAGTAYGEERTFTTSASVVGFDDNGASNAVFTVASGRTVHFSRGNLQYQASTGTWRFAEHQYDYVAWYSNSYISSSYSGWIDLFGWGTSGWNSGAVCYQPWDTSTTYSDYYPGGRYNNSLTGDYANADWGVYNAISNGGNQAGMWRTLTKDEWSYLLFSRAASTINGVANARYALAVVNGTNGLVIFPDNFTMPSGMSYPSGINTHNTSSAPFNNNTYTESQWSQMEGAGCIFLPAASSRYGTDVGVVGTSGHYWSSSYYGETNAWSMFFLSGIANMSYDNRYWGQSVRLVRDTTSANVSLPTVTTSSVSSITSSTATCGGNVTNSGNTTVTARGVCWSTSHNPTVSNNSHTTDGSGTGSFTSSITGLLQNTTYYVRAYATNSVGIAYGEEVLFTTSIVGGFDENGASNAVFTVAEGRTVHFSRGNLQYQASTGIWRFAEHQYDTVGSANSNISSSYSGWIDLFGWGTSGWNSGANAYWPWETSNSHSDYRPGGSGTNNLTGEYANADWGVYNAISNGGNQAGMWRTLTRNEWEYLLNYRAASTINGVANARYAKAVVNGTNGLVIFPDNFTMPSGMSYPSGINTSSAPFNNNTYTESQWSQMEGAGCIFLPAAGDRRGTGVGGVGTCGDYWSSSYYDVNLAWYMYFYSGTVYVNDGSRNGGRSVRLVRDTTSANVSLPTVTTSTVSSITSSSATCGGNVTNDGNATVTARGVCWSTSHNPTTSDSHTTDGSGTGNFTSSMTGLSANTTYYVRAYATNSAGTAYGNEVSFTTNTPSAGGFDQNGASYAVFTVASGRTVHFSRGNLQYQASTGIWRFAEHQYDTVGSANSNISSSYSGWIDLFGWGTSGWNSGANAYQPWATSMSCVDYYPGGSYTNSLTGAYANADWGVYNAISNGGNQAGMWRTLTKDEWAYLLNNRAASTINGVANARYAKAVVNGTNGLVIFPDNFTMPGGMSNPSGINNTSASYDYNTYTESQWSQMEGAGCIFLPAAGCSYGTVVRTVGTDGLYWSSTYYNENYAWCMLFFSGNVFMSYNYRYLGLSVRLVRD